MLSRIENNILDFSFHFYVSGKGFNSDTLKKAFAQCSLSCLQNHSSAPFEPEMVKLMRGIINPVHISKDMSSLPKRWADTACAVCFRNWCRCPHYRERCLSCNMFLHACWDLQACSFKPHKNLCFCPHGRRQVQEYLNNFDLNPVVHDYIRMKKTDNYFPKELIISLYHQANSRNVLNVTQEDVLAALSNT